MEQYWTNIRRWKNELNLIRQNGQGGSKDLDINLERFFYFSKLQTVPLYVAVIILSLLISTIEIVSLFLNF